MLSSGSLDSYDADATTRAVLDSFLKNTDDAYARYFDDARYTSFVDVATDEYPGVGVFFSEQNGKAFALDVFENSSASDAGVRQGDVVVVDRWRSLAGLDGNGDHQRRSARGRLVGCYHLVAAFDVRWLRGRGIHYDVRLCSDYQEPNVTTQLVDGVGYISLEAADAEFRYACPLRIGRPFLPRRPLLWCSSLRDNPGGYLTKAVDVASLFIRSGVVVEIDTLEGEDDQAGHGRYCHGCSFGRFGERQHSGIGGSARGGFARYRPRSPYGHDNHGERFGPGH